jgi:DNA-binding transcriptional ArsR family regulator
VVAASVAALADKGSGSRAQFGPTGLDAGVKADIVNAMVNDFPVAEPVDRTFAGLADPTRRAIVAMLAEGPRTFGDVAAAFGVSRPAVSRHLRVLRQAGLVRESPVARDGRVRLYSLRSEPLDQLDTWIEQVRRFWQGQLDAFGRAAREEADRLGESAEERSRRSESRVQ